MLELINRFFYRLKNDGLIKTIKLFFQYTSFKSKKIDLDQININKTESLDDLFLRFGTDKGYLDGKKTFYKFNKDLKTKHRFKNYKEWVLRKNIYEYDYEVGHNYSLVYQKYFDSIKNNKLNILEIGVAGGHSIATWYKYFPNSLIHGLDIRHLNSVLYSGKRFIYHQINCIDSADLKKFLNRNLKFDIIIDDSLHDYPAFIGNIINFFPLLNSNGYYFLEDFKPKDERLKKIREYNEKNNKRIIYGSDLTMHEILQNLKNKKFFKNEYMSNNDQEYIHNNSESIEIFYSDHPYSSIALIRKNK